MTRKQRLGELLALFAGPMMCGDWSKNQQAQHQLKKLEDDYIFLIAFQEIIPIEKTDGTSLFCFVYRSQPM